MVSERLCANDGCSPLDEAHVSGPSAGGMVAPARRAGADAHGWPVAEPNGHFHVGMQIIDLGGRTSSGNRWFVAVEGGAPLLVEYVLLSEFDEFFNRMRDRYRAAIPTTGKIGAEVEVVPMDDGLDPFRRELVDGRARGGADAGAGRLVQVDGVDFPIFGTVRELRGHRFLEF